MKFNIPKIIRPLEMSAYAEEMEGVTLQVWVNPTRNIKNDFTDLQVSLIGLRGEIEKLLADENAADENDADKKADALNERVDAVNMSIYEWYSNMLSQDSDPDARLSVDDLKEIEDEDPALWIYIATGTQALIGEHSEGIRKN